ncbi:glycolate oxidase FAD binding subunit [Azospirillum agricola]|uniref:glycolate oxidase subunit GlcE n=1 Tax=Azospirillum agricola TaxID=1720247 RepID=UPI001AE91B5D|nr:glycolate oxidase subunit GlcE [Azospirillum agricola]MBP2228151.1 glycolate oxidase FAD binding subunit [Azospirillum agricola]
MTITTLKPETAAQAAEAVRWALSAGEPLEILGSGTRRGLGRPVQAGHALDLSGLSGIVAYEPEELVLTALAGTPMATILPMLAERAQHLAFEPPDGGTLGGLMASGLAGPRRISAGSARDHALGIAGVSGRGEHYKGGGKVVKNVTGYDLPKLMAGSFGTLTALTEITVKVLPAPEDTATLLLAGLEDAGAVAALDRALRSPYDVSGAAHLPAGIAARSGVAAVARAGGAATLVRIEGFGPSVAARVALLREELRADAVLGRDESLALWREVRDAAWFGGLGGGDSLPHLWKLSVPPASGPATLAAIRRSLDVEAFYDWGGGLIWLTVPADPNLPDAAATIRAAVGAQGHATLMRAPESVRAVTEVFQPLPEPLMALTRRVKASFDPKGVLNPGRMHAGV